MTCTHHHGITEVFLLSQSPLGSACASLPLPTTTDICIIPTALPFSECHVAAITWYPAFSKRLIPGGSVGKKSACNARDSLPWVGKIPWRRERQPTPVFLPGEFHGESSLTEYSPQGHKESERTEAAEHSHTHTCISLSNMHLRFFHLSLWLSTSFLFSAEQYSALIYWVLSEYTIVIIYPFTYWRTSWQLPSFGNYEQSCYKDLPTDFWVDVSF